MVSTKGTLISGITLPPEVEKSRFGVFGYREDGSQIFNMYYGSPATGQLASAFDNVAVMYRQAAGGAFYYDALTLWTKGRHSFFAYFPYTDSPSEVLPAISVASSATSRPSLTYVQPTELDKMTDILTAATLNKLSTDADAQPVQLKFEHRLFAFDVTLQNHQDSLARALKVIGATIKFIDVNSVGQLYYDGTYEAGQPISFSHDYFPAGTPAIIINAPTEGESPVEYNLNIKKDAAGIPITDSEGKHITDSFLFLPCNSLTIEFTLRFINAWNEECEFTTRQVIAPEGGFKPGYKYFFTINKKDTGENIVFEPEISEWEAFGQIDYVFD